MGKVRAASQLVDGEEMLVEGRDFSLILSRDDAMVRANSLNIDSELPEGEDFSHYDDESASACGLIDFETMLESWLEFIR